MVPIQLLGTAWTVWKVARGRFGRVGALVATALIIGGMIYLTPWLAVKSPALAAVVRKATQGKLATTE